MSIRLELLPVDAVDAGGRARLFALLQGAFEGVRREDFEHDLEEKDRVMLLREADGRVVGFSTLMQFDVRTPEGEARIVFSGDTAVEETSRSFWGFAYGLGAYFAQARDAVRGAPVYYVLISKGWRTYRVLAFLFRRFHPSHVGVTPGRHVAVAAAFGAHRYPGRFDGRRGIVVARPGDPHIRPDGPDVLPVHRLADPHVAFFARANPRHEQGDELVCVADAAPENYTAAFARLLRRPDPGAPWGG